MDEMERKNRRQLEDLKLPSFQGRSEVFACYQYSVKKKIKVAVLVFKEINKWL